MNTMITLTDNAASKVKQLLEAEGATDLALRVAVRPGGCSGFSYEMFFDGDGLIAKGEDLFLEVFGGFRMHDIVDDDVGSLLGEFEDDRETDAAVSAGDDGCFSFEVHLVVFWVG